MKVQATKNITCLLKPFRVIKLIVQHKFTDIMMLQKLNISNKSLWMNLEKVLWIAGSRFILMDNGNCCSWATFKFKKKKCVLKKTTTIQFLINIFNKW